MVVKLAFHNVWQSRKVQCLVLAPLKVKSVVAAYIEGYSLCPIIVALIIQIYAGLFRLLRFSPAQLSYCVACSKLRIHIWYVCSKFKIGNYRYVSKKVLGLFRFSLKAIYSKMQMHEDPFFFEPSILNICTTKCDITVGLLQLAFNYGMRNLQSDNGGKEENDRMLVLMIVTIKYPAVWLM
jgi:hypothetical protein